MHHISLDLVSSWDRFFMMLTRQVAEGERERADSEAILLGISGGELVWETQLLAIIQEQHL